MKNKKATTMVKVEIDEDMKDLAKKTAKKQGLTFQFWLGSIIKKEIESPIFKKIE